ncbi:MAG: alpha/beta fold hydrolase [Dokdonella sp.]
MRLWIVPALALCAMPIQAQTSPAANVDAAPVAEVVAESPPVVEWLRRATVEPVVCPFRGTIDYKPGDIECGLIVVPENREVAGSRSIELNYALIRAKGKDKEGNAVDKRVDPVVYLTGGPGVGIEPYVERLKDHRLVEQRDLYVLEQRGIGNSTTFCPFFATRNRAAQIKPDFDDAQRTMLASMLACADLARAQGVDLRGYNTFENSRDVRALRIALGFETWNVWGISYGSVLGQALLTTDPSGIRAMVLDGIVPIDIGDLMRVSRWYARDLDKLFAACAAQPACAAAYPDQKQRYLAAIAAVLEKPFELAVTPSEMYPGGKAWVFADIVAGLPFSLFYEQSNHALIPAVIEGLIRAVESRDATLFKAFATVAGTGFPDISMGMATAIQCQDGYLEELVKVLADEQIENPQIAAALNSPAAVADALQACRRGGMAPRDRAQYAPVKSALPIVVANGAWDPVTPTPLAQYIMPGLSNARLVEFPHAGHGPTRSLECGGAFLNAFFNAPTAPLDMQCVDDGEKAAAYVAPYFATSMLPRAAALLDIDKKKLLPHGIWIGVSALVVLIGLLVFASGWAARMVSGETRTRALGTRWLAGLAALAAVAHLVGLGIALGMTFDVTPAMLMFGTYGWARAFAWLAPIAGVLGIIAVTAALTARSLRRANRIGFTVVGIAAISVSAFAWYWDLWPFG